MSLAGLVDVGYAVGVRVALLVRADPAIPPVAPNASRTPAASIALDTGVTSVGFLGQVTPLGERTVYYRVDDAAWARVVQRQVESLSSLGGILRDGLHLVDGAGEEGAARMRTAHAVFSWLDDVFAGAPPLPSTNDTTRRSRK